MSDGKFTCSPSAIFYPESCALYLLASMSLFAQTSCIVLEIAQMLILLKKLEEILEEK